MHVTRKRTGYTIRCTDGEFTAIEKFVTLSEGANKLSGMAKGAHTRRVRGGDFLRVDVDNRGRRA